MVVVENVMVAAVIREPSGPDFRFVSGRRPGTDVSIVYLQTSAHGT
jgi:hypothetical protein